MRRIMIATFAAVTVLGLSGCSGDGDDGDGGASVNPGVPASGTAIERVNDTPSGGDSLRGGGIPAISGTGRYVVFASGATDLVAATIPENTSQIYRRDRTTGSTVLVSTNVASEPANATCDGTVAVSDDGDWIAFWTRSTNLVSEDTSGQDVFLKHVTSGTVMRVSAAGPSTPADGWSFLADMTPDARFVLFWSMATNLVPDDTNGAPDLFRWSRESGEIVRVNLSDNDHQTGTISTSTDTAAISDDGDRVVFSSDADDLVSGDTNGHVDVFMRTISTGTTTLVSLTNAGAQITTADSLNPDISGGGQRVVFHSAATDATPGDSPGEDVFVRDLVAGTTTCVSRGLPGTGGIASSGRISGDGTAVAFVWSTADPSATDVYVRSGDGTVRRVSVSTTNGPTNGPSSVPALSRDGHHVVFHSSASNLIVGDGNAQPDVFVAVLPPGGSG